MSKNLYHHINTRINTISGAIREREREREKEKEWEGVGENAMGLRGGGDKEEDIVGLEFLLDQNA